MPLREVLPYELYISTIVEFELFMGANDEKKHLDVLEMLSWCTSLQVTSATAQQAGLVYRKLRDINQLIEIRDILIGATALENDLPLMTLNAKHFTRIDMLQLMEPPR